MNKKDKLKLLFTNPLKIMRQGLLHLEEENYRKKTEKEYKKNQLPTIDLLDLFPSFNVKIDNYSFLVGTSLITDLALLKMLAQRFDNCAYMEIGSWRGESISNVAMVTEDCTSITLSEEEMKAFNFSSDFIKNHGIFYKKNKSIKQIHHNSQTFDYSSLNKKYDLIFIDGDHSYKGVLTDTINVFKHLLKNENSIIVWHDYSFDTENIRPSVLKAILDGIPASEHKNLYHISNTMCAVYMQGDFLSRNKRVMDLPNKYFTINLQATKLKEV